MHAVKITELSRANLSKPLYLSDSMYTVQVMYV